jgi:hypothetical protein
VVVEVEVVEVEVVVVEVVEVEAKVEAEVVEPRHQYYAELTLIVEAMGS